MKMNKGKRIESVLILTLLFFLGCAQPTGDPNCTGNSGNTYFCSGSSSCSRSGGSNCSPAKDGVFCCTGGTTTTGNDGTNSCALGYCFTNPENICCPQSAQYACKGFCYTSN